MASECMWTRLSLSRHFFLPVLLEVGNTLPVRLSSGLFILRLGHTVSISEGEGVQASLDFNF